MLKYYGAGHLSRGVRVGIHCPWISHLLFADDCMVFTQTTTEGANRLQEILEIYRIGSGQLVNKQKSAVFFSANADDNMKLAVHQGTAIPTEALVEKYLGLPTALGRSTDDQFEHIVATIKKLVSGWAPKLLNSAGREVLIKAICQAIPTYSMSCFKLSKKLCKKNTAVVARFWWGGNDEKRKMHWVKWADLARPKSSGGMGFKDFVLFNKAMLAKQGWRLISNPESLCARVLKGKYFHNGDFMTARNKWNSSHTWRTILYGREALNLGLIKRIGDGGSTRI
jgi:hypothetical protein